MDGAQDLFQVARADAGIRLGALDLQVAEHDLNLEDVRAALQHVGGEGVTEDVDAAAPSGGEPHDVFLDGGPQVVSFFSGKDPSVDALCR